MTSQRTKTGQSILPRMMSAYAETEKGMAFASTSHLSDVSESASVKMTSDLPEIGSGRSPRRLTSNCVHEDNSDSVQLTSRLTDISHSKTSHTTPHSCDVSGISSTRTTRSYVTDDLQTAQVSRPVLQSVEHGETGFRQDALPSYTDASEAGNNNASNDNSAVQCSINLKGQSNAQRETTGPAVRTCQAIEKDRWDQKQAKTVNQKGRFTKPPSERIQGTSRTYKTRSTVTEETGLADSKLSRSAKLRDRSDKLFSKRKERTEITKQKEKTVGTRSKIPLRTDKLDKTGGRRPALANIATQLYASVSLQLEEARTDRTGPELVADKSLYRSQDQVQERDIAEQTGLRRSRRNKDKKQHIDPGPQRQIKGSTQFNAVHEDETEQAKPGLPKYQSSQDNTFTTQQLQMKDKTETRLGNNVQRKNTRDKLCSKHDEEQLKAGQMPSEFIEQKLSVATSRTGRIEYPSDKPVAKSIRTTTLDDKALPDENQNGNTTGETPAKRSKQQDSSEKSLSRNNVPQKGGEVSTLPEHDQQNPEAEKTQSEQGRQNQASEPIEEQVSQEPKTRKPRLKRSQPSTKSSVSSLEEVGKRLKTDTEVSQQKNKTRKGGDQSPKCGEEKRTARKRKYTRRREAKPVQLPEHWEPMGESEMIAVNLPPTSAEYKEVYQRLRSRAFRSPFKLPFLFLVQRILRVQNKQLFRNFTKKKEQLERKWKKKEASGELILYHGTTWNAVDNICQNGYDPSMSVMRMIGKGTYFAWDPYYSNAFTAKPTTPLFGTVPVIVQTARSVQDKGENASSTVQPASVSSSSSDSRTVEPGCSSHQSAAATPLSTENRVTQAVATPLSTEDSVAQAVVTPLSTENRMTQTVAMPLSTENRVAQAVTTPLSTKNKVTQAVATPLSTEDSVTQAVATPLSTKNTVPPAVATPLSTENTVPPAIITPLSTENAVPPAVATPLSTENTVPPAVATLPSMENRETQPAATPLPTEKRVTFGYTALQQSSATPLSAENRVAHDYSVPEQAAAKPLSTVNRVTGAFSVLARTAAIPITTENKTSQSGSALLQSSATSFPTESRTEHNLSVPEQVSDTPLPTENRVPQTSSIPLPTENRVPQTASIPLPTENRVPQTASILFPTENKVAQTASIPFPSENRVPQTASIPLPSENRVPQTASIPLPSENRVPQTASIPLPTENRVPQTASIPLPSENRVPQTSSILLPSENRVPQTASISFTTEERAESAFSDNKEAAATSIPAETTRAQGHTVLRQHLRTPLLTENNAASSFPNLQQAATTTCSTESSSAHGCSLLPKDPTSLPTDIREMNASSTSQRPLPSSPLAEDKLGCAPPVVQSTSASTVSAEGGRTSSLQPTSVTPQHTDNRVDSDPTTTRSITNEEHGIRRSFIIYPDIPDLPGVSCFPPLGTSILNQGESLSGNGLSYTPPFYPPPTQRQVVYPHFFGATYMFSFLSSHPGWSISPAMNRFSMNPPGQVGNFNTIPPYQFYNNSVQPSVFWQPGPQYDSSNQTLNSAIQSPTLFQPGPQYDSSNQTSNSATQPSTLFQPGLQSNSSNQTLNNAIQPSTLFQPGLQYNSSNQTSNSAIQPSTLFQPGLQYNSSNQTSNSAIQPSTLFQPGLQYNSSNQTSNSAIQPSTLFQPGLQNNSSNQFFNGAQQMAVPLPQYVLSQPVPALYDRRRPSRIPVPIQAPGMSTWASVNKPEPKFRYLLQTKILPGRCIEGRPSFTVPPITLDRDRCLLIRCDSYVDSLERPYQYVIVQSAQAYPEYIVQYRIPGDDY